MLAWASVTSGLPQAEQRGPCLECPQAHVSEFAGTDGNRHMLGSTPLLLASGPWLTGQKGLPWAFWAQIHQHRFHLLLKGRSLSLPSGTSVSSSDPPTAPFQKLKVRRSLCLWLSLVIGFPPLLVRNCPHSPCTPGVLESRVPVHTPQDTSPRAQPRPTVACQLLCGL